MPLIAEVAALICLILTLTAWFAGLPRGLPASVPFGATVLLLVWRGWPALSRPRSWRLPRPRPDTLLCVALALAYRASALVHPWGWVNRDGAYGAFVALHLLQGQRPAPVFTEGANYQGTLKGHMAALLALLTGHHDLSRLMAAASLLLSLVFMVATMALARRLAGPPAAIVTGLYLALGPRFLTVFSLNCVGQYVEVLALGGMALALLARLLDEEGRTGPAAPWTYFGIGALLGAAFWQQPVALAYALAAVVALALRRRTWRQAAALLLPIGFVLGALPVVLWNVQHGWASGEILGRDPSDLRAQAEALPSLMRLTTTVSFPILAGLSPGHPLAGSWPAHALALGLVPAALLAYLLLRGREAVRSAVAGRPVPALLPPLLLVSCLGLFWLVAAGRVHWRPRYLLPVMAATAVHIGVAAAWLWRRSRVAAALALLPLLALNVAGFAPRWREAAQADRYHRRLVLSLEQKGIRTGYADFSIAAPVTMFTAERILLSPRLGPTPAYYSPSQEQRVATLGPDAFVLRPRDDVEAFAGVLHALGAAHRLEREPVPVFYALSRRLRIEDVLAAWGRRLDAEGSPE